MDTVCLESAWSSEKADEVSLDLRGWWVSLKLVAGDKRLPSHSRSHPPGTNPQYVVVAEPLGTNETHTSFCTEETLFSELNGSDE